MGDNIMFIATILGGIGTIIGVLFKMYRFARSIEEKYEEMNELIKIRKLLNPKNYYKLYNILK